MIASFQAAGQGVVDFRNNGQLTIAAGGKVYAAGPAFTGGAVNGLGTSDIIDNFGTIQGIMQLRAAPARGRQDC